MVIGVNFTKANLKTWILNNTAITSGTSCTDQALNEEQIVSLETTIGGGCTISPRSLSLKFNKKKNPTSYCVTAGTTTPVTFTFANTVSHCKAKNYSNEEVSTDSNTISIIEPCEINRGTEAIGNDNFYRYGNADPFVGAAAIFLAEAVENHSSLPLDATPPAEYDNVKGKESSSYGRGLKFPRFGIGDNYALTKRVAINARSPRNDFQQTGEGNDYKYRALNTQNDILFWYSEAIDTTSQGTAASPSYDETNKVVTAGGKKLLTDDINNIYVVQYKRTYPSIGYTDGSPNLTELNGFGDSTHGYNSGADGTASGTGKTYSRTDDYANSLTITVYKYNTSSHTFESVNIDNLRTKLKNYIKSGVGTVAHSTTITYTLPSKTYHHETSSSHKNENKYFYGQGTGTNDVTISGDMKFEIKINNFYYFLHKKINLNDIKTKCSASISPSIGISHRTGGSNWIHYVYDKDGKELCAYYTSAATFTVTLNFQNGLCSAASTTFSSASDVPDGNEPSYQKIGVQKYTSYDATAVLAADTHYHSYSISAKTPRCYAHAKFTTSSGGKGTRYSGYVLYGNPDYESFSTPQSPETNN